MRAFTAFLLAAAVGCATPPSVAIKPGFDFAKLGPVALLDFEDYPGRIGSGRIVSAAFEPRLINAGYSLIERSRVQRVLSEQAFSHSGAVAPRTAASLGGILGVRALILGSVTGLVQDSSITYMQTVQSVNYVPVYTTVQTTGPDGRIRTRQEISQYDVTTVNDQIPVTYTTPASVGVSLRLVTTDTGEVLWSASYSTDGGSLPEAAGRAAKAIMAAMKDAWPVPPSR